MLGRSSTLSHLGKSQILLKLKNIVLSLRFFQKLVKTRVFSYHNWGKHWKSAIPQLSKGSTSIHKNWISPHHREILAALWVCRHCLLVLQSLLLWRGVCVNFLHIVLYDYTKKNFKVWKRWKKMWVKKFEVEKISAFFYYHF